MSTTSTSGSPATTRSSSSEALVDRLHLESFLAQSADEEGAQLMVVLDDDQSWSDHCSRRIAPSGSRRMPRGGERGRGQDGCDSRRRPSSARKSPGDREVVGRRVEDVLEHRDEHLREQPAEQRGERERRRASTSAASLQRKAPISRSDAPSAAMVASSWRRSARPSATNSAIAAAASTIANASSIRLIPRQVDGRDRADRLRGLLADVLDERPVGLVALRDPGGERGRIAARLDEDDVRARVVGSRLEVGEVRDHERVLRRGRELLDDPDDVERHDPEAAARAVEDAQLEQVADAAASSR